MAKVKAFFMMEQVEYNALFLDLLTSVLGRFFLSFQKTHFSTPITRFKVYFSTQRVEASSSMKLGGGLQWEAINGIDLELKASGNIPSSPPSSKTQSNRAKGKHA
jgi:hypothetical protein